MAILTDELGNPLLDQTGTALDNGADASVNFLNASNLILSSPSIGRPTLGPGYTILGDRVLDVGLAALDNECNRLVLCSAQPTTFAEANVTFMLAHKTTSAGGIFAAIAPGSPSGRSTALIPIADGFVAANGIVTHWAAVDTLNGGGRLLAYGPVDDAQEVTTAQPFAMISFDVTILGNVGSGEEPLVLTVLGEPLTVLGQPLTIAA